VEGNQSIVCNAIRMATKEVIEQMGEVLLKTNIKREQGILYYCATDENGNITLCCAKMVRGRKKEKE
jgi:hypothetical protein